MATHIDNARIGHLAKVRIDLDDTNQALKAWWDCDELNVQAASLHTALEALMRAVSTLTLVVEGEVQR